jgi:NAD(P)-dependent dehydrogenase (short-subunit alcohol dehydrogenase family)
MPEDMLGTALFLLSDEASFVTGQDIRVNGGASLF